MNSNRTYLSNQVNVKGNMKPHHQDENQLKFQESRKPAICPQYKKKKKIFAVRNRKNEVKFQNIKLSKPTKGKSEQNLLTTACLKNFTGWVNLTW